MSIWVHFTGGFGLDGCILNKGRWNKIWNEIRQLISPLPYSSNEYSGQTGYKIKLHDPDSVHFADVFLSMDARYADSLQEIEDWLLKITEKMKEKDWEVRCGCFFAHVEYQPPVIYYYDGGDEDYEPYIWRKIEDVNGEILKK
jgi:hypothetical protein